MKFIGLLAFVATTFISVSQSNNDSLTSPNYGAHFNTCDSLKDIIHHQEFSLIYNDTAELAEWVAYSLTTENFSSNIERTNDFREDSLVKGGSSNAEDYVASGYDRGHLAPAGSMRVNESIMSECFLYSNICPQLPAFNRGVWKRLEEKIRYWTEIHDSILVVSGPILDNPITSIGYNEVYVPRAYFKALIAYKDNNAMGIGFLLPHEASSKSLYAFVTSIDDLETITGHDFYCNLEEPSLLMIERNDNLKKFIFKEE